MAEAFGTVAAAIQLAITLNLLGQLCKDAKDVRQTIEDAHSDLTRLSILIRQHMPHAKHNNDDSRLLALNILNCAKWVIRVRNVLGKMERYTERAPPVGRLCAVIISIELKHLLGELNSAEEKMDRAVTTFRYNRKMSVRVHRTLKTWSLKLRNRSQALKEGMPLDTHASNFCPRSLEVVETAFGVRM